MAARRLRKNRWSCDGLNATIIDPAAHASLWGSEQIKSAQAGHEFPPEAAEPKH